MLEVYRLRQFAELIEGVDKIEEVDKELVFKVLGKIEIIDKGHTIIRFLDGTELECEMGS